jgi:pilus assembly protein CpaB
MIKNLTLGNMPNRMPLMLGLLLGIISAALIVVYLGQGKDDGGTNTGGQVSGETMGIVVANQDIPAGTKITAEMLSVTQLPLSVVLTGAFEETTPVIDKVTSVPIIAGEQVLPAKISDTGVELDAFESGDLPLSVVVPAGKRAFSVQVSEVSAAGGLIKPGYYVDVLQSGEQVSATDSSQSVGTSCYIAQDVQVLAVGQELVQATGAASESAEEIAGAGTVTTAISVTLAVTPQETAALAAAQRNVDDTNVQRQVWLAVRPFGEHGAVGDLSGCQ